MLGERIRQRRVALGLTQAQLASATGMKQFHISRIESGDIVDVKGDTLRRLALALRVTADHLLEIDDESKRASTDEDDEEPSLRNATAVR